MSDEKTTTWLEKTPIPAIPWLTVEVLIFAGVVILAIASRFYNLGARVMSHDESLHTYFSWLYYKGQGYQHNPMMHGPLQFHLIALTYFIFGASDFTARMPAAIFSILTVAAVWQWRRYLGRAGAIVAAVMTLISPILLFYGRYTREDPYVGVSLFIMLYSILRYLETGKAKYIFLVTGALALHFLTKETAFIYAAETLIYLGVYFVIRVAHKPWKDNETDYRGFLISLIVGIVFLGATVGVAKIMGPASQLDATQTAAPAIPLHGAPATTPTASSSSLVVSLALVGVIGLAATLFFLLRGYGWEKIRQERSFDLLIVILTLVLPMLSAFAMSALSPFMQSRFGFSIAIPTGEQDINSYGIPSLATMAAILLIFAGVATAIGLIWNKSVWWKAALLFFSVYTLFYTSFFTNGAGFFTGIVGSLGYWLEQQGVARGSQPWYYYLLIEIPIYEFLPAVACLLAFALSWRQKWSANLATPELQQEQQNRINTISLLGWWTIASIISFTLAGEKMPWLTFHLALPMVLFGGWGVGQIIEAVDWADLRSRKVLLTISLLVVFIIGAVVTLVSLFGNPAPFAGKELAQLQATTTFIVALLGTLASAAGLYVMLKGWSFRQMASVGVLIFFGILAILTVRTSIRANYVLYDSGMEYLVYAHGYTGVKDVMAQVTELSEKTTGDPHAIVVAYDDQTSWPLSWYMRDFKNAKFYGGAPGVDLRQVPAIIVGAGNYSKVEPIVGDNYYKYEYIRMVWPNQDYFNLTSSRDSTQDFPADYPCTGVLSVFKLFKETDFSRLCNAVGNPQMREAIFDIWLNRDYTKYAQVTGSTGTTPENWDPSDHMRLYIRKDVAQLVWKYGAAPIQTQADPYAKGTITLAADQVVGSAGTAPGQFNAPRGLAFAPDGTYYVADSRNHRIEHFGTDGQIIKAWGTFADVTNGAAGPGGTFNEPWGVAVGPDGSVYVSDTWNGRVQKFDKDGNFIKMWGSFGQTDTAKAVQLYGPRGITVDTNGHVYVADTGNKRIVVFDSDGNLLAQFGSEGYDVGKFSEPVDVKLDTQGNVYVTDTWNQRVQVFSQSPDGKTFTPLRQWAINGWKSQSLENKPFISIASDGHVFVTDPEGYRVLEFNPDGTFVQTWGNFGTDSSSFGLASGIAIDAEGHVWVTDSANNRVLRFTVPAK